MPGKFQNSRDSLVIGYIYIYIIFPLDGVRKIIGLFQFESFNQEFLTICFEDIKASWIILI